MINLIKMEVYRLFHMTSLYVLLALVIIMAHFAVDGTSVDLKEMEQEQTEMQTSGFSLFEASVVDDTDETDNMDSSTENGTDDNDSGNVGVGISVASNPSWLKGLSFPELMDSIYSSGLFMLFVAIFIPLFVAGEQKSGYVKNIIGQLPYRGQLALSKLIPVVMEILLMFAVFNLCVVIFANIYMDEYFTIGKFGEFLAVTGYQLLAHIAFGIMITFVVLLLRGTSGAMVFGILLSMDLLNMLYTKLEKMLDIKVSGYMLSTNMRTVVLDSGSKLIWQGVVVSVLFLAASLALSVLLLQKRDIR